MNSPEPAYTQTYNLQDAQSHFMDELNLTNFLHEDLFTNSSNLITNLNVTDNKYAVYNVNNVNNYMMDNVNNNVNNVHNINATNINTTLGGGTVTNNVQQPLSNTQYQQMINQLQEQLHKARQEMQEMQKNTVRKTIQQILTSSTRFKELKQRLIEYAYDQTKYHDNVVEVESEEFRHLISVSPKQYRNSRRILQLKCNFNESHVWTINSRRLENYQFKYDLGCFRIWAFLGNKNNTRKAMLKIAFDLAEESSEVFIFGYGTQETKMGTLNILNNCFCGIYKHPIIVTGLERNQGPTDMPFPINLEGVVDFDYLVVNKLHVLFGDSLSPQSGYQRLKDTLSVVVPESPVEQEVIVQAKYDYCNVSVAILKFRYLSKEAYKNSLMNSNNQNGNNDDNNSNNNNNNNNNNDYNNFNFNFNFNTNWSSENLGNTNNNANFSGFSYNLSLTSPLHTKAKLGTLTEKDDFTFVNQQNEEGKTALMLAAEHGFIESVKLLLVHNADTQLRDKIGRTASFYAYNNRHDDIYLLIKKPSHFYAEVNMSKDLIQENKLRLIFMRTEESIGLDSLLGCLPAEILQKIAFWLPFKSFCSFSGCCKILYEHFGQFQMREMRKTHPAIASHIKFNTNEHAVLATYMPLRNLDSLPNYSTDELIRIFTTGAKIVLKNILRLEQFEFEHIYFMYRTARILEIRELSSFWYDDLMRVIVCEFVENWNYSRTFDYFDPDNLEYYDIPPADLQKLCIQQLVFLLSSLASITFSKFTKFSLFGHVHDEDWDRIVAGFSSNSHSTEKIEEFRQKINSSQIYAKISLENVSKLTIKSASGSYYRVAPTSEKFHYHFILLCIVAAGECRSDNPTSGSSPKSNYFGQFEFPDDDHQGEVYEIFKPLPRILQVELINEVNHFEIWGVASSDANKITEGTNVHTFPEEASNLTKNEETVHLKNGDTELVEKEVM